LKKIHIKIFLYISVLLQAALLFPQEVKNLDSLEQQLNGLRNTNPDKVIKTGNYILKHSTSERQKAYTMALLSFAYFEKKDAEKSTELLFKSKELADETKDIEVITRIYGTIAQMYLNMGLKDKSVFYLRQVIEQVKNLPEGESKYNLKGLTYIELGKISLDEKKYREANNYFKNSLFEFNKNKKSRYYIKRSYYNIGNSFYEADELDSAQFYLNRALQIRENPVVNDYVLLTLSNIYNKERQFGRAADTLSGILNRNKLHDDMLKSEIYLTLLKNYNTLGEFEKYNFYNEKYLELNNAIKNNNLNTIKNVVSIEEKSLNSKISSAHLQNFWLLFILSMIVILGAGIVLYMRHIEKMQKKQYEAIIYQLENRKADGHTTLVPNIKDTGSQVIAPETEHAILGKLIKFERSDKFTNSKLNISTVAILLKTNTSYLSQIINTYKGKNFNAYINELRINYICEKIHNHPEYLAYKISYLGELAGFTSHSTFTTIFKSVTGISPSAFLKEAENRERQKIE
jgi:AraC-like DNA-binding protein/Tfp pilus assembly protein PilF